MKICMNCDNRNPERKLFFCCYKLHRDPYLSFLPITSSVSEPDLTGILQKNPTVLLLPPGKTEWIHS